jgi:dipeptidyl aminopeptidase/acylaminoacyl peptidase
MLYNVVGKAQSISESLILPRLMSSPLRRTARPIYLCAEDHGRSPIYSVAVTGGPVKKVIAEGGAHGDVHLTADGKTLVFSRSSMTKPSEIFRADASGSGSVTALTTTNDAFISPFNLRPAEDVTWTGAGGAKVGGWLIQPPNFANPTGSTRWWC